MKTVIKNGWLIDPAAGIDQRRDVVFEDGLIVGLPAPGTEYPKEAELIDAADCIVMPGLIDLHVHLREPGYEQKETILTGGAAAVAGGFTSVCCMANTNPVNDHISVTSFILQKARAAGKVRVYPMGSVTKGLGGELLTEMGELTEAGCVGFTDDGRCVSNADVMRNALVYAKSLDAPIAVHAIDEKLAGEGAMHEGRRSMFLGVPGVPSAAEDIMVARDTVLAILLGARLHVQHVTTKGAVRLIRDAKAQGARVTGEAAPHHFTLTDEDVGDYDTNFKTMPPLRSAEDREAIIEALADGTLDAVATDHAPHENIVKDCEFEKAAHGVIGLETALPLTWDLVRAKKFTPRRAVELLTAGPARAFSLPRGSLAVGATADITIFDPRPKYVYKIEDIVSLSKNSPFIGRELQGRVVRTIVDGKTVFLK